MAIRWHSMPYGAEVRADGVVRFNLWAPGARHVDLHLLTPGRDWVVPLTQEAGGWFRLETDEVGPGARYRYRIDGSLLVPDPASRHQPEAVHGPSQVIDPRQFVWTDDHWQGRPWEDAVVYELHTGTFSPEGTFAGVQQRLDHLVDLGVSAVELMPAADFPGWRNWGYDGVLPFAPARVYGTPDELKALIQAAHARGLMVLLDVVYNHFGPEGNYLHAYAPGFFTSHHHTPWGDAINFDGPDSRPVREFFIHNALYWLEEFHLDGLRLDAVHAIVDDSDPDILMELAERVTAGPGAERCVHLVLENDANAARYLTRTQAGAPRWYRAQWNDDIHHGLHVLLTGERDGYYADYGDRPTWYTARALSEGFAYQGDPSAFRDGVSRGERSGHLPPTAFVNFLQNHDQIGNRAFGERIEQLAKPEAVQAAMAVLLLAPSPPLLFMGQEFGCQQPFPFFCDFGPELAESVTRGRRREFAHFPPFAHPQAHAAIPDPNARATFTVAKLDWARLLTDAGRAQLAFYRALLALRQQHITPRLRGVRGHAAQFDLLGTTGLQVRWTLGDGSVLTLLANLGDQPLPVAAIAPPLGTPIYARPDGLAAGLAARRLPPWAVAWYLGMGGAGA